MVNSDGQNLARIAQDVWEFRLARDPQKAMMAGREIETLPDISYASVEKSAEFAKAQLSPLRALSTTKLSRQEQIICKTLEWDLERELDVDWWWYQFDVTPYASPLSDLQRIFSALGLSKAEERERYLHLLGGLGQVAGDILFKLQEQYSRGIILPQDELPVAESFLSGFTAEGNASPFWARDERLDGLENVAKVEFQRRVGKIIRSEVNPRLQELAEYLAGDYRSKSPGEVGLSQYPGGGQAYEQLIALRTSLRISPEAVHEMGMRAVGELNEKMAGIRAQVGFTGSKVEFHERLKHDSRFFAQTAEEVGDRFMGFVTRLEPHIPTVFSKIPNARYGVQRLPAEYEKMVTFGFYEPPNSSQPTGYYFYNGSDLENRPLFSVAGLIYHELVPGHHFQVAQQIENQELPPISRFTYHNAYVEGWAEYAAELAGELGMYADPYDYYGRLAMHMFTAVRLVVDSGMNAMNWSREQAKQFMRENILESESQIESETLRYAVDIPAQALGYKLGNIKFHELRERFKARRGARYDIRAFHDETLKYGSMPLQVLEWHLETVP